MKTIQNPNEPATKSQTFMIFLRSKYDVRACGLSKGKASEIIDTLINFPKAGLEQVQSLAGAIKKGEAQESKPKIDFAAIIAEANKAGREAIQKLNVVPMTVIGRANPLDDSSKVTERYFVADGCCGFASVVFSDGRSAIANYLRKNNLGGYKHYYGGYALPVHDYNQSLQKKECHASAMCGVFQKYGIKCHVDSRMD